MKGKSELTKKIYGDIFDKYTGNINFKICENLLGPAWAKAKIKAAQSGFMNTLIKVGRWVQYISGNAINGIGLDEIPGVKGWLQSLINQGGIKAAFGTFGTYALRYGDNFICMFFNGGTPMGGVIGIFTQGNFFEI